MRFQLVLLAMTVVLAIGIAIVLPMETEQGDLVVCSVDEPEYSPLRDNLPTSGSIFVVQDAEPLILWVEGMGDTRLTLVAPRTYRVDYDVLGDATLTVGQQTYTISVDAVPPVAPLDASVSIEKHNGINVIVGPPIAALHARVYRASGVEDLWAVDALGQFDVQSHGVLADDDRLELRIVLRDGSEYTLGPLLRIADLDGPTVKRVPSNEAIGVLALLLCLLVLVVGAVARPDVVA